MQFADTLLIETLGLGQPWHRMLFVGAATTAVQHVLKVPWAYENGQKRPFAPFADIQSSEEDFGTVNPTWVPWWFLPGLLGGAAGVFV
jgi:hypothetical protein